MILGGMDVSGDPESGNYQYMSIVICTSEGERYLLKQIGTDQIHMNQMQREEQDRIISALKFDGRKCIAFCIRLDRNNTIDRIMSKRTTRKNISRAALIRTFDYFLWIHIRDRIVSFLAAHGADLYDVYFQCDSDCDHFAKDAGLYIVVPGAVHGFADAVAWGNNKDKEPEGVIMLDLTSEMDEALTKRYAR